MAFVRSWRVLALAAAACASLAACGGGRADECKRSTPSASGPGDAGNHFPHAIGDSWIYEVTSSDSSGPPATQHVEVTGTRAVESAVASVFTATALDGGAPEEESLISVGPSGVALYADPDVDPVLRPLFPYQVLEFPLSPGRSFVQISCEGLDYGEDLDLDGKNERLDVHSVATVEGDEDLSLPAGAFTATRVSTQLTLTLRATAGGSATVVEDEAVWYAPGVGLVRSSTTLRSGGDVLAQQDSNLLGYEVSGRRGGLLARLQVDPDVARADSDTSAPGSPAVAWGGSAHLLVGAEISESFAQDLLRGYLMGTDRSVASSFEIADWRGYGLRPAAAWGGEAFLVASVVCTTYCDTLLAQRIGPAGQQLDGDHGFPVTSGSTTVYPPALASSGSGWLVAWATFGDGLHFTRIDADGGVLGGGVIDAADTGFPAVAFAGGTYLVAWADAREGATQILGKRIDPAGTVLDASPIVISSAPGLKELGGATSDGSQFLVAWSDGRRGDTGPIGYPALDVYAARLSPEGALLDGPAATGGIEVNALDGASKLRPAAAYAGGHFVVAWWVDGYSEPGGAHAARVGQDGTLLDPVAVPASPPNSIYPDYARAVFPVPAAAAEGATLVAWVRNSELSGARKSLWAAWFAW
jgi:hypothetical protein